MRHLSPALLAITFAAVAAATASNPVVDGHNHEGLSAVGGVIDTSKLADLKSRGIDVVIIALPIDRTKTSDLTARISAEVEWLQQASLSDPGFTLAENPKTLLSGVPHDGIQVLFSIEWFHNIFGSQPSLARTYSDLGVRVIGLAEDDKDGLFGSGDRSATLSPFGRKVISAINATGILIDITHLTHEQKLEVISYSRKPVVATHSLTQAVVPNRFNLPEEVLSALALNAGSVWVSFQKEDLLGDAGDEQAIDRLIDHIDVLIERLGPGHVGIGTDLQAGGKYVPVSLSQKDSFARIRQRLQERGFEQDTIDGILGGNILRILAESGF
jgi:membrane dipeptidase